MTIIFELNCRDNLERSLIPEFCSNIIESMRHDITSKISRNKLQAHEKDILNSEVIRWGIKPRSLNMSDLLLKAWAFTNIGKGVRQFKIHVSSHIPPIFDCL